MSALPRDLGSFITEEFEASMQVKRKVIAGQMPVLIEITKRLHQALQTGGKVIIFGNGGSAADSQHIAAELVSKYRRDRVALPAIALTTDTSILTSVGNDYHFDRVFARQVEALGLPGDVAWGISTSGNSPNVINALKTARHKGLATIGFTGEGGGTMKAHVDLCFCVPSHVTARIQESHLTAAHAICDLIEQAFAVS